VTGNCHARFLGEGVAARSLPYPTVGTFAEFERAMLRERTQRGLEAARKQGRVGGRRSKLNTHQLQENVNLVDSGQKTAADAARLFNVYPSTVSRILKREKNPQTGFTFYCSLNPYF
jgi:DNA invertase Pin-like site-specific DNA recombinase